MSKTVKPSWRFPCNSSRLATVTFTTIGSLLVLHDLMRVRILCEWLPDIVVFGRQQPCGLMPKLCA